MVLLCITKGGLESFIESYPDMGLAVALSYKPKSTPLKFLQKTIVLEANLPSQKLFLPVAPGVLCNMLIKNRCFHSLSLQRFSSLFGSPPVVFIEFHSPQHVLRKCQFGVQE